MRARTGSSMARALTGVCAAAVLTIATGTGISAAQPGSIQERLRVLLDDTVRGSDVPGAQLVFTERGGEFRITGGVGDLGTGAGFPDDAQVRIASNTKVFVAAVVLQLAGEGRIALDEPLERYMPGEVRGPGGDGTVITVRNLLQHTSGIPDYLSELNLESVDALRRARPPGELIGLGLARPAEFEPGSRAQYSNTNYLLAGELVHRVTGVPVGVEVTRRILLPQGLNDTYWPLAPVEQVLRGPHARAYHQFGDARVDVTDIDAGWGLPDGVMVSTGADLNRFFMALLSGQVLGPAELAEMQRTVPSGDLRRQEEFGLGLFGWVTSCGLQVWGHGGTMHGTFVYGGATADRSITVSMNQIPDILAARTAGVDLDEVVDTALCSV